MFVTPNRLTFARPDEVIDPYHYVEYSPDELAELCRPRFAELDLHGLFGSPRYLELVAAEHARLDRLLRLDPLRLRRALGRRVRQRLYDTLLRRARTDPDPRAAAIERDDFELRSDGLERALDLVVVCRRDRPWRRAPTRHAPAGCRSGAGRASRNASGERVPGRCCSPPRS